MTRFVLVGGADRAATAEQKRKLANVLSESSPAKVLSVPFASPREDWEKKHEDRREFFEMILPGSDVQMAMPKTFEAQVRDSDVVYIHGGDETLLAYWLDQYSLQEIFKDKVIVGSSAGAEYLATYFNTPDWREIKKGSGIVTANVIVHFESSYGNDDPRGPVDWQGMRRSLEEADQEHRLYCISEGDFVVIEQ